MRHMAAARRIWALMAVLATIALTSFTVQAILEDGTGGMEGGQGITGQAVAEEKPEPEENASGFSDAIEKAADWVLEG